MKSKKFICILILILVFPFVLIVNTSIADVRDQQSYGSNLEFRTDRTDTWQQEVIAGVNGSLTKISIYAHKVGKALFFINMGSPWQSDSHNFKKTISPNKPGWFSIDTSSAKINIKKGTKFVIGIKGTNGGLWFGAGDNYDKGSFWHNEQVYSYKGNYYYDMAFTTYVGEYNWDVEIIESGGNSWRKVNGIQVTQRVISGSGDGIENFKIYGYIATWALRDGAGWNTAYYYVDLITNSKIKRITQNVGYKVGTGIENFKIINYRAIWGYRDEDGYNSAYYYIDCSKGEDVNYKKQITPNTGYWAVYDRIEDFKVVGNRVFYEIIKDDKGIGYYYIDLSKNENVYDRKRVTQGGGISNFEVNGNEASWSYKGDNYYRILPDGHIQKERSSSGDGYYGSGYYGSGFYGSGFYGSGYYGGGFYGSGYYGSGFYGSGYYGGGFYGSGYYGGGFYGGYYGSRSNYFNPK